MGKSAPSAPPAPDPTTVANAQGAANLNTAIGQGWMNALNQYGPQGSITYNQTGSHMVDGMEVPQFSQTTTLSPEQQNLYNLMTALQGQALGIGGGVLNNVGNAVSQPFSLDGIPAAPGSGDFTADRDMITQNIIQRNQPQMASQREALEAQLANQGIMPGSRAFQARMDDLGRQENDFRLAAINAGGAEQSRLFGLGSQAHNQAIQDLVLQRSQPINEYATLLGLGGQVQAPNAQGYQPGQIQPTDVVGPYNMQYQGQLANWNAQNQAQQGFYNNLGGLGGALGSAWIMSDPALKTDIKYMGIEKGFPIYHFRYKYDPSNVVYRGVMATDVLALRPDAVIEVDGYMAVNYKKIGIEMEVVH